MNFSEFVTLPAEEVRKQINRPIGIGIPFNGTRRWYMRTFNKTKTNILSDDYLDKVFARMREVLGMMFDDGIHTVFTPVIGRDLAERGQIYMQFSNAAIAKLGTEAALTWYREKQIHAAIYGQTHLLFGDVQHVLKNMEQKTRSAQQHLRYGIFADRPLADVIAHTTRLYEQTGVMPSEKDLLASYYDEHIIPVDLWIGSDQPTIFDVPLVVHGNTALYFLQFPTLFLDRVLWRRILYDFLHVRGDQETLYPDNISSEKHIIGLGVRKDGFWMPATS